MIIFLYGSDGYRIKENVDSVAGSYRKKHKSGVNYYRLDMSPVRGKTSAEGGSSADHAFQAGRTSNGIDELSNAVKSVSFFDEVKLVVIKNVFDNSTHSRKIMPLINDLDIVNDKNTVLLFAENKSKNELQKIDKELFSGLCHKDNLVKEIEPLNGVKLSNWIKNKFKENGHNVSPAVVSSLVGIVGNESWALANEVNKLSNYLDATNSDGRVHSDDRIRNCGILMSDCYSDAVDLLVGRKEINSIFELTDAVGSQNKAKAFEMMYRLTNSGHDPHYILSMLVYHLENLLSVYDGSTPKHLHPFVAKKAASQARGFSKEELLSKFNYLAELDIASKNGMVNLEDALYVFTVS